MPDSWPRNLENAWTAQYGRLDIAFERMCQHLVENQLTSDAFQEGPDSFLFQWDTNVWDTWPQGRGHKFWEDWDKEGHINHPNDQPNLLPLKSNGGCNGTRLLKPNLRPP